MTFLDRLSLALLVAVVCLIVLIGIAVTVPVILIVGLPVVVWQWLRDRLSRGGSERGTPAP